MHATRTTQRAARIRRIRAVVRGTANRPRLAIERTAKHFRAQLIDDEAGKTLVAASDSELKGSSAGIEQATAVGTLIAEKAGTAGITAAVLDRRGYQYHGRVAAFADAARAAGLAL